VVIGREYSPPPFPAFLVVVSDSTTIRAQGICFRLTSR
jgi:hypothetical protein